MSNIGYVSTRGDLTRHDAAQAISVGLAPDGGLYVPEKFPRFEPSDFDGCHSLAQIATALLQPFMAGSVLAAELSKLCADAFIMDAPLVPLLGSDGNGDKQLGVLELFHGPTAAFKDFGARFLAECMARIEITSSRRLRILVATSGDTGGAVAAAFRGHEQVDVDVFYPAGMVSPRQEKQLTCWGGNIRTFKVRGHFDDCQALVKAVFRDPALSTTNRFSSANSINLGRLLPQMVYYAQASLEIWRSTSRRAGFIIPTGNVGNAMACVWARRCGLPIGDIVLATNANRSIPDFLLSGKWTPRQSIETLASAMDVGNPSNMERMRWLTPEVDDMRRELSAYSVSDQRIRDQIARDAGRFGQVWCPHTATALSVYDGLTDAQRAASYWVVVATAHPAKFESIVEPLVGHPIEVPMSLAALLDLPSHVQEISSELEVLRKYYS